MRADECQQLSFISQPRFVSRPIVLDRVYALSNTNEALEYACELARTSEGKAIAPKQIAPLVGVDKTTWSRICGGEFDLDGRDILPFSRVVGNDAYLLYLNHIHDYDLTTLRKVPKNDLERENQELRSEIDELRRVLRYVTEAQKGKG
ncbi:MAG TPA: hypothetical protein VI653_29760 [Steroidobacteraceae bacterium]